ncbi:MAG TPA: peptidyl-prolyl cis-trans isomerase [Gemmataceae bacterium]|nr:peptidyl-prolyl cis-trans isomerase [Gemmataceae bacterium]
MDAANRLRSWLVAAGLAAGLSSGCTTCDGYEVAGHRADAVARGQAPTDLPGPAGPLSPANLSPTAPTTQAAPPVQPVGYAAGGSGALAGLAAEVTPRIKVVAVVGSGNIVTDHEVWEATRQRLGEYAQLDRAPREAKEREIYREELRRIVERELILDDMFARLKKAKPQAIEEIKTFAGQMADRQLRDFMKMYQTKSEDEFKAILKSQGLSMPVIRRQMERQMMTEEYVRSMLKEKGRTVGLAEIRAHYTRHPNDFKTDDAVKWLDLFVSFNKFETPRAAYDHALAVQQEAARGGDFVTLVKKHDHGDASLRNGEGAGTKRGEIRPADVEPVLWLLQPGQVSNLIETPAGYHIVKVVERQVAGVRAFDEKLQAEIRDKLMRKMREQEYTRLVEELWRKSVVEVRE